MASSTAKSTHSPEIQSISTEKAPDSKNDNTLSPQEVTDMNNSKVGPTETEPAIQDEEDGASTADIRRWILETCYRNDGAWQQPVVRRFENLSLANLEFYEKELNKLEREVIIMNVEGGVSDSAVQRLRHLLKEYCMRL